MIFLTPQYRANDRSSAKEARRRSLLGGACIGAIAMLGTTGEAGNALAQSDDEVSYGIEEVIVTARKREESMQDTPIAMTAMSGEAMTDRNLTNLMEVGAYIPNVLTSVAPGGSGGGNNGQIYIRGVGQTDFLFTTDPGVGVYIDGVYHPRTLGGVFDLLDIEQIEVLRGPQGTLFGKNTIGGAFNVTSKKPTGDGSGYIEATVGRYNRIDARASFDVSLIENTLAAKISVSSKNRDGYGKRLDYETDEVIDHTGNENSVAARAALRWTGSENVTVDITADVTREREQSVPTRLMQMEQNALAPLWNAFVASPYPMTDAFITDDPFTTYGTGPNRNDLDLWGLGMSIDWDMDSVSLKSITAYREMDAAFGRDGDGSPNEYVHTDNTQSQSQFSQEFQLTGSAIQDKLDWVVGAFYMNEKGYDHNDVRLASGMWDAFEALPGPTIPLGNPADPLTPWLGGADNPVNDGFDLDFNINNWIDIKSWALFSQGSYAVSDKLNFTAGVRYSEDKKDYTLEHLRVNAGVPIIPLTPISGSYNATTFMASLDYRINDDLMTYGLISRGYKSGGFNGRPTVTGAVSDFSPEFVLAYEIGFKSDLLDNTMRLNVAAFFNDYTDIQLGSVSADGTGNLVLLVQNAGEAEVKGFEVEMEWQPTSNFSLVGSLGHTDFKFTKLNDGVVDVTLDTQQPQSPKWNAAVGAQYQVSAGENGRASLRADWSYRSKVYQEVTNTESIAQKGFSMLSMRLVYENLSGNWEVAALVTNLTDKRYIMNGLQALDSFGTTEAFYGRPREWGVSLKKRF